MSSCHLQFLRVQFVFSFHAQKVQYQCNTYTANLCSNASILYTTHLIILICIFLVLHPYQGIYFLKCAHCFPIYFFDLAPSSTIFMAFFMSSYARQFCNSRSSPPSLFPSLPAPFMLLSSFRCFITIQLYEYICIRTTLCHHHAAIH